MACCFFMCVFWKRHAMGITLKRPTRHFDSTPYWRYSASSMRLRNITRHATQHHHENARTTPSQEGPGRVPTPRPSAHHNAHQGSPGKRTERPGKRSEQSRIFRTRPPTDAPRSSSCAPRRHKHQRGSPPRHLAQRQRQRQRPSDAPSFREHQKKSSSATLQERATSPRSTRHTTHDLHSQNSAQAQLRTIHIKKPTAPAQASARKIPGNKKAPQGGFFELAE